MCTSLQLQFPMYSALKDHFISFYCCEKSFARYALYMLKEMDGSSNESKRMERREIVNNISLELNLENLTFYILQLDDLDGDFSWWLHGNHLTKWKEILEHVICRLSWDPDGWVGYSTWWDCNLSLWPDVIESSNEWRKV